jgi:hypothetical protein
MGLPNWLTWGLICVFLLAALDAVVKYRKHRRDHVLVGGVKADVRPPFAVAARGWALLGVLLVVSLGILTAGFLGGEKLGQAIFDDAIFLVWLFKVGGVLAAFVLIFCIGIPLEAKWCPHCNTFNARTERVELLGQQTVTTRTHENATVHKGYGSFGPVVETIRMPVERTRLINHYLHHKLCSACGMRWTTK